MAADYAWTERNAGGFRTLACERGRFTARVWTVRTWSVESYHYDVTDDDFTYAAGSSRSEGWAQSLAAEVLRRLEAT